MGGLGARKGKGGKLEEREGRGEFGRRREKRAEEERPELIVD